MQVEADDYIKCRCGRIARKDDLDFSQEVPEKTRAFLRIDGGKIPRSAMDCCEDIDDILQELQEDE